MQSNYGPFRAHSAAGVNVRVYILEIRDCVYDKGKRDCGQARVRSVAVIVAVRQRAHKNARGRIKSLVRRSKLSLRNRTTLFIYNMKGIFVFNTTAHQKRMFMRFALSIPLSNPISAYGVAQ
jgi:hypothetical protein